MNSSYFIFYIASFFVLQCTAINKQEDELFDAITEGRIQDLEVVLIDHPGDITERIFTAEFLGYEFQASPLEIAAACCNPIIMTLLIEKRRPVIEADMVFFILMSRCEECFDILLDNSNLTWSFNKKLFDKLIEFSPGIDLFLIFLLRFLKRLNLYQQLALIEAAFNTCNDHEQIIFTVDAVILDIARRKAINEYSDNDERSAVISFARAMIFKKDFDDMLPWIDSLYYQNPKTEKSKNFVKNFTDCVKRFDDRAEDYPQPEEIVNQEGFKPYLRLSESIRDESFGHASKIIGIRVLLNLLNKRNRILWNVLEKTPSFSEKMIEMNRILDFAIEKNSIIYAKLLLEAGFNFSGSYFYQAIQYGFTEMVKLLLNYGANPKVENDGESALMIAASNGSVKIVKLLLEHGAISNIVNGDGNTPLMLAAFHGSAEIVSLLLKNEADPNAASSTGNTALIAACYNGSLEIVELLLNHEANVNVENIDRETPLILAARHGSANLVELLLNKKANPNVANFNGDTPLSNAALKGQAEVVESLLNHGANANYSGNSDNLPLIIAVINESIQIVKLLLEHGANPRITNSRGNTTLGLALKSGNNEIASLLQDYGANC